MKKLNVALSLVVLLVILIPIPSAQAQSISVKPSTSALIKCDYQFSATGRRFEYGEEWCCGDQVICCYDLVISSNLNQFCGADIEIVDENGDPFEHHCTGCDRLPPNWGWTQDAAGVYHFGLASI